jgi:oligogalacturonide lyase
MRTAPDALASEKRTFADPISGVTVRQVTSDASSNQPLYFTHPGWSPDGRRVVFASDRGGHAHVCVIEDNWHSLLDALPANAPEPRWGRRRA